MTKKYYVGLDVGGTKVEGAVAELNVTDRSIKVFSQKKIDAITTNRADDFINSLIQLINELVSTANIPLESIHAIGIGLPGSLDPHTKIMLNGNTRYLLGIDVLKSLKSKLGVSIPIFAENDANLFVLAEAWAGVGKKFEKDKEIAFKDQVAIGITLGTGVGGGLISFGKVYSGAHGAGLEVGHISLYPGGHQCYCGQQGCAESYLSGTALNKISSAREIFEKANANDEQALKILNNYRKSFIHFLSVLNNLFNPHYFVFGGGLSSQAILFNKLKEDLEKNTFLPKEFCPEVYINQLGDGAGLFGAMIYAQEILDL
jgi:predicted NBD/HSP70 family sugar kinase